ncbi:MAG TPA: SDR family NAD(P)-dependent oxidoreductase [Thermoleophilaceae bacterium]|nr:SDR family NAD(P)-dependent oxidoreductase [Thermoleophilaceae bacterium]
MKTILITGATDGLGRALAADLAATGARLLVHGRDEARGRETVDAIRAESGNDNLELYIADLSELAQVRRLAEEVAGAGALDVLVSNAGIGTTVPGGGARQESSDGIELRFAVNYLAGYLLTRSLLGNLTESARIVHVSSAGQTPIDFEDPMLERDYSGVRAYCQSKLAQIMFTFDLAEELAGTGVTANALHPATYMPTKIVPSPVSTLEEGVAATRRLVDDAELDGVTGRYFNGRREARADAQAYDPDARRRLRELSDALIA